MELLQPIRFYRSVASFEARRFFAYKNELFGQLIGRTAPVIIMVTFWHIVSDSPEIAFSLREIISYFLLLAGVIELTAIRNFAYGASVAELIETGRLSNDLLRPIRILPVLYAKHFGQTMPYKVLSLGYITVGLLLSGINSLGAVLAAVIAFGIALAMSVIVNVIVASMAFWLTKVESIRIAMYFSINAFTGLYIPVYLMPEAVQAVVFASPVVYFAYLPVALLTGAELPHSLAYHFGLGLIWLIVLGVIARLVWRRGLQAYDSVGI